MPTARARFRISIKDHHTGEGLKVELVDVLGGLRGSSEPYRIGRLTENGERYRWIVDPDRCASAKGSSTGKNGSTIPSSVPAFLLSTFPLPKSARRAGLNYFVVQLRRRHIGAVAYKGSFLSS